jgi:anti-anti-sigma regulatory factor
MSTRPSPPAPAAAPPLRCLVHDIGGRVVRVVPHGDLSLADEAGLDRAVASLRADVELIIVDLCDVACIDRDGTRFLLDATAALAREGRRLVVVSRHPDVQARFERLGAAQRLTIVRPVAEHRPARSVPPELSTPGQVR